MYFCLLLGLSLVIVLTQIWNCGSVCIQVDTCTLILLIILSFSTLFSTKAALKVARGVYYMLWNKKKNISLFTYRECLEAVRFTMKICVLSGSFISALNLYVLMDVSEIETFAAALRISMNGIMYGLIGCFLLFPMYCWLSEKIMNYVPDEIELEMELEDPSEKVYFKLRGMGLTTREAEIGKLIVCKKMSNKEIADELFISELTVKKHVTHILGKLEIKSRDEIIILIKNEATGGEINANTDTESL